jgi:hypothetical protein
MLTEHALGDLLLRCSCCIYCSQIWAVLSRDRYYLWAMEIQGTNTGKQTGCGEELTPPYNVVVTYFHEISYICLSAVVVCRIIGESVFLLLVKCGTCVVCVCVCVSVKNCVADTFLQGHRCEQVLSFD